MGLAVVRSLSRGSRVIGFVVIAVFGQIFRNWLLLHAVGVDASFFDAIAVLIAVVVLGQFPVGPSGGAAAAVLILGSQGVAAAAAGRSADDRDGHGRRAVLRRMGRRRSAVVGRPPAQAAASAPRASERRDLDAVQERIRGGSTALDPSLEAVAIRTPVVGRHVDRLRGAALDDLGLDAAALHQGRP